MKALLWGLQALLAALFVFAGVAKLMMPIEQVVAQVHLPGAFMRFISIAEILGGIGLILPGLLGILPDLTSLAAAGLVIIMIGAIATTLASGALLPALFALATGVALAFVGYARWKIAPFPQRRGLK